ncbi:MAG: hypothetical protein ACRES8_04255 [Nevskiaceae bacterium]
MAGTDHDSEAPLFVLATRLFVHYKFKTRKTFDPSATLIDDAYAREVLALARAIPDARLKAIADLFETARFGGITPPASSAPAKDDPMLDLSLDTPG